MKRCLKDLKKPCIVVDGRRVQVVRMYDNGVPLDLVTHIIVIELYKKGHGSTLPAPGIGAKN